jgi:serine/threonine protein kinase
MDAHALYDQPFHPFHQTRTIDGKRPLYPRYLRSQRPVRYYYIDFGYARWFRDGDGADRTVVGWRAREQTPEQVTGLPYDPFRADIFQLGAMIRRDLIPVRLGSFLCSSVSPLTDHLRYRKYPPSSSYSPWSVI